MSQGGLVGRGAARFTDGNYRPSPDTSRTASAHELSKAMLAIWLTLMCEGPLKYLKHRPQHLVVKKINPQCLSQWMGNYNVSAKTS